ncbi:hypothetical protein [Litoreibacter arenae]|nr:hypothetical protein [Litoreibacter arenae]
MLKPTARNGHELACGSCGAPLHEMKWLKSPERELRKAAPAPQKFVRKPKPKKRKRSKPLWHRALEEVWDEIEDIFD